MRKLFSWVAAAALPVLMSATASAHVTLENQQATPGSTYKAVLRVPHGCEGSPTTAVRVRIPEGMIAIKPMPKPGWELKTTIASYAQPVDYHGTKLTEGVAEVAWTGGNLPDVWYDEFVFRGQLPNAAPGSTIWFSVVQECVEGTTRWIEVPPDGKSADDYEHPAAALKIIAKP